MMTVFDRTGFGMSIWLATVIILRTGGMEIGWKMPLRSGRRLVTALLQRWLFYSITPLGKRNLSSDC
jgi:hypothetical protein